MQINLKNRGKYLLSEYALGFSLACMSGYLNTVLLDVKLSLYIYNS